MQAEGADALVASLCRLRASNLGRVHRLAPHRTEGQVVKLCQRMHTCAGSALPWCFTGWPRPMECVKGSRKTRSY